MTTIGDIETAASLDALYPILAEARYTAGWHKKRRSLWPQPTPRYRPRHWRYPEARAALERAGTWIGTDLAERRNLLMFNPLGDNDYATANTLVAAYQMIKPNEYARTHRHTPNALRLILDADEGLFTVVDGVELPMVPGDVLLTPGRCWHSHYNTGSSDAYWIDVLDVPLVHLLEPMFFEELPGGVQTVVERPESHPFRFRYEEVAPALAAAVPDRTGLRRHVLASQSAMPTMALSWIGLDAGAGGGRRIATANRILAVVRGEGRLVAGDETMNWARGDVLVVPAWTPWDIVAGTAAEIFEVTDEPAMRALGFYFDEANRP